MFHAFKATSSEEENVILYFRRKSGKREDTECEDRRKQREMEWWREECGGRGGERKERKGQDYALKNSGISTPRGHIEEVGRGRPL